MRPPYLVCERHCLHYAECREVLELFTAAELRTGRAHPIAFVLADHGCPLFMPRAAAREAERLPLQAAQ